MSYDDIVAAILDFINDLVLYLFPLTHFKQTCFSGNPFFSKEVEPLAIVLCSFIMQIVIKLPNSSTKINLAMRLIFAMWY